MSGSTGSTTLREFLVGLGFQVDEQGFRKMVGYLETITKNATLLGVGMTATATAIGVAVVKMATQFESLFYLAQRTGTTVANLQAMQLAFGQVGLSAQDAAGAIAALGEGMRTNPGLRGLAESLGVHTKDATGNLRDTTAVWVELMGALAGKGDVVGSRLAGMFGMSQSMYYQLKANMPALLKSIADAKNSQAAAGANPDDLGAQSKEFMNAFRRDVREMELILQGVQKELMGPMTVLMNTFDEFLKAHSKEIQALGVSLAKTFGEVVGDVVKIVPEIDKIVAKTLGWKNLLEDIGWIILWRWLGPLAGVLWVLNKIRETTSATPATPEEIEKDRQQREKDQSAAPPFSWWNPGSWLHHSAYYPSGQDGGAFSFPAGSVGGRGASGGAHSANLTPEIEAEVRRQAALQGVDQERAVALFRAEGGGYSNVSPAGAIGPGQLMPGTAQELGVNPWNWRDNVRGGVMYLARMLRRWHGDYDAAEASYNAGPGGRGVGRLAASGDRSFLPKETQDYLNHIDRNLRAGSGNAPSAAPAQVNQSNTFHIQGRDAEDTARQVQRNLRTANADLVRWGTGAVVA